MQYLNQNRCSNKEPGFFGDKKIRVNAVSPGLIRTKLAKILQNTLILREFLKRIEETQEISDVVEFLLSKKSSYINGQIINVDGGMFSK